MSQKQALINVYDKTDIVDFVSRLIKKYNYKLSAYGDSFEYLKENNIEVNEIDKNSVEIQDFDIAVINLCPFENLTNEEYIEVSNIIKEIDSTSTCLIRDFAKTYFKAAIICNPDLYNDILANLIKYEGEVGYDLRKELAIKAFEYTSSYDFIISNQLRKRILSNEDSIMPDVFNLALEKATDLKYGENPYQAAALYKTTDSIDYDLIQGTSLTYNNLSDIKVAYDLLSEFIDVPTTCFIKHNNPSGLALGDNIQDSFIKALNCDPIASFGAVIGFNEPVNVELARYVKDLEIEVIVAPDFTEDAINTLSSKPELKLVRIETDFLKYKFSQKLDIKQLPFGTMIQTSNNVDLSKDNFKVVTKNKPTEEQVEDMVFAWKIVKHSKSNSIVVVNDKKLVGIGASQASCIAALDIAISQSCEETKGSIIASDGYIPAIDSIHACAQSRIAAIIQPGGAAKDIQVIEEANKYDLTMIFTNQRQISR